MLPHRLNHTFRVLERTGQHQMAHHHPARHALVALVLVEAGVAHLIDHGRKRIEGDLRIIRSL